jgi:hypothetical protein
MLCASIKFASIYIWFLEKVNPLIKFKAVVERVTKKNKFQTKLLGEVEKYCEQGRVQKVDYFLTSFAKKTLK